MHWPFSIIMKANTSLQQNISRIISDFHRLKENLQPKKGRKKHGAYRALDEAEIVNVAIKKDHQNHGYGAEMVQALIGEEKKNGVVSFILEVRPSNLSAHRCYQKLGFRTIGIRRDFYDCPKENALVMKMESIAGDE